MSKRRGSTRTRPVAWRIVQEAMAGVVQRSSRSAMTVVGIALGVASFIAVLGVTASANAQISSEFLQVEATQITVTPAMAGNGPLFPEDADDVVSGIDGVAATGRWWNVYTTDVRRLPEWIGDPSGSVPQILAASPGYWDIVDPTLSSGRLFDAFLADQAVAVIGENVAREFGITTVTTSPVLYVDGVPLTIIGIVANTSGSSAALTSIVMPDAFARATFGPPGQRETMIVQAERGAAAVVASQLSLALDPSRSDAFRVVPPPEPAVVRDRVSVATRTLFYALAGIGLLVSGVGIANVSLLGVIARTREIALRRSLGALPRHIAAQFLLESAVRGVLGGTIGTALAVAAVAAISLTQQWTAVIEPWSLVAGPVMGVTIGTLAGLYPAIKATRVQPVEAFRQ